MAALAQQQPIVDGAQVANRRVIHADVCVVGSGAGGAPAAALLAEAGRSVVVVEDGPSVPTSQLTGDLRAMMAGLYRDGGQTMSVGNTPIIIPVGRAVGGTTLVNSGTCLRTPDDVLAEWAGELGLDALGPGSLDDLYEDVERVISVGQVTPELAGANARRIESAANALGWSNEYLPRNASGCVGSGVCAFGCPTGAKQHTAITYMERAHAAGSVTYAATRADRVRVDKGRVRGVVARTEGGGKLEIRAPTVVVAAGTFHTPGLLAASGIRNEWLGENLSIHPATGAWGVVADEVGMGHGVPQSLAIDEFAGDGLMLEGISGPPSYMALSVPYNGQRNRELMARYSNVVQFGLMVRDRSRGHVATGRLARRSGTPLIRYDISREDTQLVFTGIERLAELLFAAGAERVITPISGLPELRDGDLAPLRATTPHPARLKLMAFHPLGTARMAADPDHGVLDADGRVHGTDGLFVADGSAVPSSLGVNPQLTIMALATRLARHIHKEY